MCLKHAHDVIPGVDPLTARSQLRRRARARVAVSLVGGVAGVIDGSWAARAPDIRRAVGAGDTAWGLANSMSTVGTVVGMGIVLVLIGRVRTRRLALASLSGVLLLAPLVALSPSVVFLGVGLALRSFAGQVGGAPGWAMSLEVQRQYGRPLLGALIACYSLGNFAGGGLGTLAAAAELPPWVQLAAISIVFGSLLVVGWRWLPDVEQATRGVEAGPQRPIRERFTRQLGLLAGMRFLTIFMAAALGQWGAIYTAQTLGGGSVLGAATYSGMSIANTLALLVVGRAMARVGRMLFFQLSTVAAAMGLGGALVIGTPMAAAIGFVAVGLGTACIDPVVYGAAGEQPGISAGEGASVVETGEVPAGLVSSAFIGLLAGEYGLRIALVAVVAALVALAILAGRVRALSGLAT